MDRSEAKAIVDREIEPLMGRLGIPHWRVTVSYGHVAGESPEFTAHARCTRHASYNQAHVEINHDEVEDEEHLLKLLRHELLHVVLSPFDPYRNFACAMVAAGSPTDTQEGHAWQFAVEQAVVNLERMYRGLADAPAPARKPRKG